MCTDSLVCSCVLKVNMTYHFVTIISTRMLWWCIQKQWQCSHHLSSLATLRYTLELAATSSASLRKLQDSDPETGIIIHIH
jgi:hypothetical protein